MPYIKRLNRQSFTANLIKIQEPDTWFKIMLHGGGGGGGDTFNKLNHAKIYNHNTNTNTN